MTLTERIKALAALGNRLLEPSEQRDTVVRHTAFNNSWFTEDNQRKAIKEIAKNFLNQEKLEKWVAIPLYRE